jgi:hypothetical protein
MSVVGNDESWLKTESTGLLWESWIRDWSSAAELFEDLFSCLACGPFTDFVKARAAGGFPILLEML